MVIGEDDARGRECVELWRLDLGVAEPKIIPPEVIDDVEEYVRPPAAATAAGGFSATAAAAAAAAGRTSALSCSKTVQNCLRSNPPAKLVRISVFSPSFTPA